MLRKILAIGTALFVVFCAVLGHGAYVEWDSVLISNDTDWAPPYLKSYADLELYYPYNPNGFWGVLEIVACPDGDQIRITSHPGRYMEYWINSAFAERGDIIDESATPHLSLSAYGDWGRTPDPESILVPTGAAAVFYLVFTSQMAMQDDIFYGWIELEFDDSVHEFRMVHSAVTTGGDPLTVGVIPIPEPSSAALLVLGLVAACVARCKRNRNTP